MDADRQRVDELRGIVPSLNTPFQDDGSVDHVSLRRLVDFVAGTGCVGALLFAVAGEGEHLTDGEFGAALHTAVEGNGNRIPLFVSVTASDQPARLRRARISRDAGADGVLCQAFPAQDPLERRDRLAEVADSGPPLFILQDLDWSGGGLPVEEIVALQEQIDRFRSLKIETAPAGPKYTAVREATGGRLHLSGGWAVLQMIDALDRGVDAFMPTELEEAYVAVYDHHRRGEREKARVLWERLLPILAFSNQEIGVSIRFFKQLRVEHGLFTTATCRAEVPLLDRFQQSEADRLSARYRALLATGFRPS